MTVEELNELTTLAIMGSGALNVAAAYVEPMAKMLSKRVLIGM